MLTARTVAEQWAETVDFYEEIHPAHRRKPMTVLVAAVAETGVKNGVWPSHSHFDLTVLAHYVKQPFVIRPASLTAVYWHEVDRFQLHFWGIQGVSHDTKWCELTEAEATLRYQFRQMREAEAGAV